MRLLLFLLPVFLLGSNFKGVSFSEETKEPAGWPDAPSIYIQVDAKTWKTRGRIYWDVEGSMIKKLSATGFKVVRLEETPHQFTLNVGYREERGEQYDINAFGTVIQGTFVVDPPPNNSPGELKISEASTNTISGTPPYLDVLHKFQTNPYYFFIGGILRGNIEKGLDPRGGLIYALDLVLSNEQATGWRSGSIGRDAGSHLHTMDSERVLYKNQAIRRAIDDCVEAEDRRVIPVLSKLLSYPNSAIRVHTIEAMGTLRVEESRSRLLQMAQNDPDTQVRETAKMVENSLEADNPPLSPQP